MNSGKRRFELTSFQLKLIAIITMTFDHIGVFFVVPPFYVLFRVIGRIAFPIFCFLITEGFVHTRSIRKYILRLSVLAVVSEPILDKCLYGTFFYSQSQSVLIQFVIALFALCLLKKMDDKYKNRIFIRNLLRVLIILLLSVITYICKTEYGILGFMMILSSYYFRQNLPVLVPALLACNFFFLNPIQAFGGLAVLPIILYKGKQGRKAGLWTYFYYPVHIAVLYVILVAVGVKMSTYPVSGTQVTYITTESPEKLEDMVFDEETISFVGHLPSESNGVTETYKTIELGQNRIAILLHGTGESFKIGNGKNLKFTADIISDENATDLKFGVIQNNKFVNLQTITGQKINVTLNTAFDNSYPMLINESSQIIRLENCKIELR